MNSFWNAANLLTLSGILLAIAIAMWQWLQAKRAKAELQSVLESLPDQLVASVKTYVAQFGDRLEELSSSDFQLTAKYADLDGDGNDELLIQTPLGAHGSHLKVFGFRDWEFKLVDELDVSAPSDFEIRDIDGDGRLEVVAIDQADTDFPYVCGFRDEVVYRLEKDAFIEIDRKPLYKPHELQQGHVDGD